MQLQDMIDEKVKQATAFQALVESFGGVVRVEQEGTKLVLHADFANATTREAFERALST